MEKFRREEWDSKGKETAGFVPFGLQYKSVKTKMPPQERLQSNPHEQRPIHETSPCFPSSPVFHLFFTGRTNSIPWSNHRDPNGIIGLQVNRTKSEKPGLENMLLHVDREVSSAYGADSTPTAALVRVVYSLRPAPEAIDP